MTLEVKEAVFQRQVLKFLKSLPNCFYYKAQASSLGGIPDVICGINGYFLAMELKRSDKHKPTPLQQYTLDKIRAANNQAFVVFPENWESVKNTLLELSGGKNAVP